MSTKHKPEYTSEKLTGIKAGTPAVKAAGMAAVTSSLKHVFGQSGVRRGTRALLGLNQKKGFDCPSCAWPDPDDERASNEYCENGAKAIAAETTRKSVGRDFFKQYSVADLADQSDYWLEQQGRLAEPMFLGEGADHYVPLSWDDAVRLIAEDLSALDDPNEAIFYTSGRASNEAAFLYQLLARSFGTNNLPDCSNMCHESSGVALGATVGVGKGTVTLEDFYHTDAVFILGQNPGTNHPRMMSALQQCKRNGGKIVSVNPLKEPGLMAFAHPQEVKGFFGKATTLTDLYLQVKINGDMAFLKGLGKCLLRDKREDLDFIQSHTSGFEAYKASLESVSWDAIEEASGLRMEAIESAAHILKASKTAIFCWAMGLTQHTNAVATIMELVNVQLMLGNLGKPGAGLCPVRGHSNVQGDRTMGIYEKMPDPFLNQLSDVFAFDAPRRHGYDTVDAIRAMHKTKGHVFIALGGNFLSATPDTDYTAKALRNCELTVQISTKLNRSHLVTGKRALILPCLGRSEMDRQASGLQFLTMENSMGVVHRSEGRLEANSVMMKSEPEIVSLIGEAACTRGDIDWKAMRDNYDCIRDKIEAVIPGFDRFNQRMKEEGSFYLPNAAKDLNFDSIGGKAKFTQNELGSFKVKAGRFCLMTIRSHDQFNTTIYGLDDRYRGIYNERRVVFLNLEDMHALNIVNEQPVDLVSYYNGEERRAPLFLAIAYDIPRGQAAAYFPETNVLVPIDSVADTSNTPTSKSIEVAIYPHKPSA